MSVASRVLAVLLLGTTVTLLLFSVLGRVPDPPGADGYFYLKQIERLSSGEGYYYKDRSLAFLLPAAIAFLSGNPLAAFRLSIAIIYTLLVFSGGMFTYVVATASELPKKISLFISFVCAAAILCSMTLYEFTFEYYKNSFALLLLMFSLIVWYSTPAIDKNRRAITALLVLGALLSHKSSLLFVIMFTSIWFLGNRSKKNIFIFLTAGSASLAVFLMFFERGHHYLLALATFVDQPAQWLDWLIYTVRKDAALSITLGTALLSVISYAVHRRKFSARANTLFDTFCLAIAASLIPFFTAGPSGPLYRVLLFSPLFAIPLLLTCVSVTRSRNALIYTGITIVVFLSQMIIDRDRFKAHFATWSGLDGDIVRITKHVTPKDHLIAHHGLEFYVDYRTGIRARQFLSSNFQKRTFRLAYVPEGRPGGEARGALDKAKLEQFGVSYALFREADWVAIVGAYGIAPHWKNPSSVRPDYIPDYE
jgi:hypothetical protein